MDESDLTSFTHACRNTRVFVRCRDLIILGDSGINPTSNGEYLKDFSNFYKPGMFHILCPVGKLWLGNFVRSSV